MNKQIFLIKTHGCTACKAMEHILETVAKDEDCELIIKYNDDVPNFIQVNVKLTDFPTTVLIKNDFIRYSFVGTKSVKKIKTIMKDINF